MKYFPKLISSFTPSHLLLGHSKGIALSDKVRSLSKRLNLVIFVLLSALVLSGCKAITTVIDRDAMPTSENGFFTESGRFFVASGEMLYEVESSPEDEYQLRLEQQGEFEGKACTFSGLTAQGEVLYTTCVETGGILGMGNDKYFVRIDLTQEGEQRMQYVPFPENLQGVYPNGMAVDSAGAVYVSNSTSLLQIETGVIYKLTIEDLSPMSVNFQPWLGRDQVELFPNGIQIAEGNLYFVNGPSLKRMAILEDGPGAIEEIYRVGLFGFIDDFALAGGKVYLARLGVPVDPVDYQAIVVVSVEENRLGKRIKNIKLDGIIPSSVAFSERDGLFPESALLVTDFFNGGLFQITGY